LPFIPRCTSHFFLENPSSWVSPHFSQFPSPSPFFFFFFYFFFFFFFFFFFKIF
jgi:hypothetical protein